MIKINILGNTNYQGEFKVNENESIISILNKYAKGMTFDKNICIAQVGGPLGEIIWGDNLNTPLKNYRLDLKTIMVLNENFCPVDFSKFIIAYVKREMGIKNEELEKISSVIEELSSGNIDEYTSLKLENELSKSSDNEIVIKLRRCINTLYNKFRPVFEDHIENKKCKAGICYRLFPAQCINACPAEINIPGYVALMHNSQYEQAYRLMREKNPLSFICGKVCARPCETKCRRGEIEQMVGVRALKHFVATKSLENHFKENTYPANNKKIAIVGSGPCGLSAAYFLAKAGYSVEIFEKYPVVGGMLAVGIPSCRLSQASIDKEVKLIGNLGVKISTNTEIGKDIQFNKLQKKFDAILLATGTHVANTFSEDISNLEAAIDFLREVKLNDRKNVGKNVIVIGGGDVAMDAARTALRLGAQSVHVVSLELYLQMPANDEEKEDAIKEGIVLHNGFGVKHIENTSNMAESIVFRKCLSLYDLNNNFSPIFDDEETMTLSCDHIILAIGQKSDISYVGNAVDVDKKGRIKFNKSFQTSVNNIFVAGDMCSSGSAIKAIAQGREVAISIDKHLCNTGLFKEEQIVIPEPQIEYGVWDTVAQSESVKLYSKNTMHPFKENKSILNENQAKKEAFRCMRCDRNSRQ
ncbi:hypothetical protein AN639_06300 [Candidatus Epulonipiscium fishelsonii]|uniref:Uncharacterized protein n=1 Tax=Candidatus Epulonipiscium fishelsonii TaxID=77094 RepID=A0ACC8XB18_9FIRM|nr:hypothetical protein AN639_06300 [Epulopiscium sp. SCG-B05WGA-EpuloA1]ONI39478.1 hypothetical protein AN396_08735 [Epulopiscium sp. SCG-B11WGA-EpuloA1]